jgi:hypothetical protein|tara:strand:- start:35 stop:709 length:675 start_codon:yes stop_codon:yes gene_type:complete
MLFEISQDTIEIDIPEQYTKIGIKASGGLDSTILSYMLALYKRDERPDIDIIPITLIESTKPFQFMYSSMSLQKISELTGITFGTHYFNMVHTHLICEGQDELVISLYDNEIIEGHFYGVTLNPPADAFPDQAGVDHDRDRLPAGARYPTVIDDNNWQPFANIDKKGICELYESLGVLNELFPLTHSCEMIHGEYLMQLDLSKHCGYDSCWWCQERLWGFGELD